MADYTPVITGGSQPSTMTTSAPVTGGQVLIVTGSDLDAEYAALFGATTQEG